MRDEAGDESVDHCNLGFHIPRFQYVYINVVIDID